MDLSVIVPCYNTEKHISALIHSLKAQELGEYEVEYIFVLNNCTDNTEKVIKDSGLECRILTCDIQGCGTSRNVGVENSNSTFIWFIDSDDYLLSKTAISSVLSRMYRDNLNVVRIPYTSLNFNKQFYSMVWQYCYRREFIKDLKFRKKQPGEDNAFSNTVLYRLGYTPYNYLEMPSMDKPLYYYNYMRNGSNMERYMRGEDINES